MSRPARSAALTSAARAVEWAAPGAPAVWTRAASPSKCNVVPCRCAKPPACDGFSFPFCFTRQRLLCGAVAVASDRVYFIELAKYWKGHRIFVLGVGGGFS